MGGVGSGSAEQSSSGQKQSQRGNDLHANLGRVPVAAEGEELG